MTSADTFFRWNSPALTKIAEGIVAHCSERYLTIKGHKSTVRQDKHLSSRRRQSLDRLAEQSRVTDGSSPVCAHASGRSGSPQR